jgi:hypothetical protein
VTVLLGGIDHIPCLMGTGASVSRYRACIG